VIDLHLHTTASDGRLPPDALIVRAKAEGLTVISITDHDTVAGLPQAARAAGERGVRLVPGIEITAVENERDVHILGYFIDPAHEQMAGFLREQRIDRRRRVRAMADRLESLGYRIDVDALLMAAGDDGRSVGRPALADALVAAGHVGNRDEAFGRLLASGRPAFVPRCGAGAGQVIDVIHAAGGIASLAHPGLLADDSLIPMFVDAGLDALEVWHSDHSPEQQTHYSGLAARLGLARSGGSDFHGDGTHRASHLGATSLPAEEFAALEARASRR
jgi:predicted metal-dependent phosphoesterase TrpH